MDTDGLKTLYAAGGPAKEVLDHMAARDRNQRLTKLKVILRRLRADGSAIKKSEVIAAFRKLEQLDCGRYIEGRHGHDSRFDWEYTKSLVASKAAAGIEAASGDDGNETEDVYEYDTVDHTYYLREDFSLTLTLPIDLTVNESKRLATFLKSLPLEDFQGE